MIDLLDFMILNFFVGKNLIVVIKKMFFNIVNFFKFLKISWYWVLFIDFVILEFDERVYKRLV